ncbi:unnamed protein product, partial [Adineta ricciae]
MVREVEILSSEYGKIEHLASKIAADDGIQVDDLPLKDDVSFKHRSSITDDESGYSETTTLSARASPVQTVAE